MKKKVISFKLARRHAFAGKISKTASGLSKSDLVKSKTGKIVSKRRSLNAKKSNNLGAWTAAVKKARKALNIKGFVAIKKGTPFYKKAKEFCAECFSTNEHVRASAQGVGISTPLERRCF